MKFFPFGIIANLLLYLLGFYTYMNLFEIINCINIELLKVIEKIIENFRTISNKKLSSLISLVNQTR